LAKGKRTIAFASSVALAEKLAAEFRAAGIMAVAVDGDTPAKDRIIAFEGFADRKIEVLVNCQLWIEGFDMQAQVGRPCTIECVLDYAATQSLARHLQKHGRGLRKDDGEPHILLDLVGGFLRDDLGLPCDERTWSLDGCGGATKTERGAVPLRRCEGCYNVYRPIKSVCPFCGKPYEVKTRKIDVVEGTLKEVDRATLKIQREAAKKEAERARKRQEWACQSKEELLNLAKERGYKDGWAHMRWESMQKTKWGRRKGQEQTRMW
jgi:superfamily II DNA or RNA helicase